MDLTKFSIDDLQKTRKMINEFLNKEDNMSNKTIGKGEEDYVPDETVDTASHEETGTKETNETVAKQDEDQFNGTPDMTDQEPAQDEQMTETSQADVLDRILEALNDLRSMIAQNAAPAEVPPEQAPPMAPIEEKSGGGGQGMTISIGKEIAKQLKLLGLTKSVITEKPKIEQVKHPLQKGNGLDMKKLAKMSMREVNQLNEELQGSRDPGYY